MSIMAEEPQSFDEAMESPDVDKWRQAVKEELQGLIDMETWEVKDVPQGKKPVSTKWVFKVKKDEHGNVTRYKGRLVACGFTQILGEDYFETFVPVVRATMIRTLLVGTPIHTKSYTYNVN